jgi:trk system potassium uptake protein
MVTIAVIGMGSFGCRVVDELEQADADVIILDKDRDIVEKYKGKVRDAYITDAINDETLRRILPEDIDAVIVDLGSQLETSILVTNHLHKMGIKQIVVKAHSNEHGEILKLVGATDVIYPDLDAALHITPILVSPLLFNYIQISEKFALAEVSVRSDLAEKTLAESKLRQKYELNLVAVRNSPAEEYAFVSSPSFILKADMLLLVAGTTDALHAYTEHSTANKHARNNGSLFSHIFRWK